MTSNRKRTGIIVSRLPRYLDRICLLIRKTGREVFYLQLSHSTGDSPERRERRIERLRQGGVIPLPIESLPSYSGYSTINSDPEQKALAWANTIAPEALRNALAGLFPGSADAPKKLLIAVHSEIVPRIVAVTGKVTIWAREHPGSRYLLVDLSPQGLLLPKPAAGVRVLAIPLEIVTGGLRRMFRFLFQIFRIGSSTKQKREVPDNTEAGTGKDVSLFKAACVIHKGFQYGNLYDKDLFCSDDPSSVIGMEKLLFLDYSGWPAPAGSSLTWVRFSDMHGSFGSDLRSAFSALRAGIPHIRHIRECTGVLLLAAFYAGYRSYATKLESFPGLKVALIDYDILCPKSLLMAFERRGIRTVAVQERFILSCNNLVGVIAGDYLCASRYAELAMMGSPLYSVDRYIPAGQYRSDILLKARAGKPPEILQGPRKRGLRVITALGFHTTTDWPSSRTHPLVSWSAHSHFLRDMIRLAREIPDVFIVLRFKDVDWMSLPCFADIIGEINASDNIRISTDYDRFYVSYDLCAHSDLVIAKHTSLADECLSVGIPVLFHEYTHNTRRIVADAFDYQPAKIMCFSYDELVGRTRAVLSGESGQLSQDYEYLKREVFGGLSDGRVRERIHNHIKSLLPEP